MPARNIQADDQLIVQFEPGSWRLLGPDGNPVFEARPRVLYYQPLFGRWRDLPPGDRMSVDAVLDIHVRWQRGWVVGLMLGPNALWRPLVRWQSSRDSKQAEEAARALSHIIHRPLRMEDLDLDTPVTRVRVNRPVAATVPPLQEPAPFPVAAGYRGEAAAVAAPAPPLGRTVTSRASLAAAEAIMAPAPLVFTVSDVSDVHLPLHLGGGSSITRDSRHRLMLLLADETRVSSVGLPALAVAVLAVFLTVIWVLSNGLAGGSTLVQLGSISIGLIVVGIIGILLLPRLNRQAERRIVFDRLAEEVLFPGGGRRREEQISLAAVHGVRITGRAVHQDGMLAYERTVALILDTGDRALFSEIRPTSLPSDPAVMPSLQVLRRQADEQAGPSLARAGARVLAWYLGKPLADE
jgi:hypothetical protein